MKSLIEVDCCSLSVPVFQPNDRQLMTNPLQFIADLYLSRTQRGVVNLLDDISLKLEPGERLGVIGANGAGKSTLLRLLAGIYAPTLGVLRTRGVVKGLFDISLGMNPEATGLENVYIRGLQMGYRLNEIRTMIPEILEFSELEEAIERPLNTFSTGMRLRLAVAVSTMKAPDVLLLDEWIGTGDSSFRDKLRERMHNFVDESGGLVIASHDAPLMRTLCTQGVVLEAGRIVFQGDLEESLDFYQQKVVKGKRSVGARLL
ncbi:MAG: ABC transporter ATP-binding protein [Gammaproteobacteria bacterium]|jgi:ABC-type polysaccharide/polyol phosphate transport system ATPase subunit|nr:ABC transporter ATP-binding protein [Gammaproteobacteria bacterium]